MNATRGLRRSRWLRAISAIVVVGVTYYAINFGLVIATARSNAAQADETRSAQAILVLGAAQYNGIPSKLLAARLDHAADLYRSGAASRVMVTGGKREGDVYTEAEASRNYLVAAGVPANVILAEDDGDSTFTSLANAATILSQHRITNVILVTDPFHAERSALIASEVGLNASVSPTPTSVVRGAEQLRREAVEAGGVAVGRVIGFERLTAITG